MCIYSFVIRSFFANNSGIGGVDGAGGGIGGGVGGISGIGVFTSSNIVATSICSSNATLCSFQSDLLLIGDELKAKGRANKKKQDAQAQLLRQKQKSDEAAKRLQDDIQRIKTQKVQLQQKIKLESEQFRLWKASREKEVLQLKKEGRRNEYEMHKLLALNQRQKMVLQRKTEEADMATKRLKEVLDSRKATSRIPHGDANNNGPSIQVSELKKKQDAQAQLLRQKQKSDEAAKRLQDDIQRIKTQKVVFLVLITKICSVFIQPETLL
ncbi:hypothetical protein POM88_004910 [Heracleum sosnowskyi]|uniref:Uncharacterized protein n=1 Tax=Heracleum sosnowskyi TaxID=360622 RepID=A0AAD8JIY1_9APIA|nr:hypothetical protein POM88_004910 [Heracleum sosnowskyi]